MVQSLELNKTAGIVQTVTPLGESRRRNFEPLEYTVTGVEEGYLIGSGSGATIVRTIEAAGHHLGRVIYDGMTPAKIYFNNITKEVATEIAGLAQDACFSPLSDGHFQGYDIP